MSPGSNPPFAAVSKFGYVRSLHGAPFHPAVDAGGNVSDLVFAAWLECFPEKAS